MTATMTTMTGTGGEGSRQNQRPGGALPCRGRGPCPGTLGDPPDPKVRINEGGSRINPGSAALQALLQDWGRQFGRALRILLLPGCRCGERAAGAALPVNAANCVRAAKSHRARVIEPRAQRLEPALGRRGDAFVPRAAGVGHRRDGADRPIRHPTVVWAVPAQTLPYKRTERRVCQRQRPSAPRCSLQLSQVCGSA